MTYKEQDKYLHSAAALQVAHGLGPQPDTRVFSYLSQQHPALLSATMPGSSPSGVPPWPEWRPLPTTSSAGSSDLAMLVSLALQCPGALRSTWPHPPDCHPCTRRTSPPPPQGTPSACTLPQPETRHHPQACSLSGPRVCALLQKNTPSFFLQRQRQVPRGSFPDGMPTLGVALITVVPMTAFTSTCITVLFSIPETPPRALPHSLSRSR